MSETVTLDALQAEQRKHDVAIVLAYLENQPRTEHLTVAQAAFDRLHPKPTPRQQAIDEVLAALREIPNYDGAGYRRWGLDAAISTVERLR